MNKFVRNFLLMIFFIGITLNMNFYKLQLIINLWSSGKEYPIFPWSENPIMSKSNLIWLYAHVLISIFHAILSSVWLFTDILNNIHGETHFLFSFVLLFNLTNFVNKSTNEAIIINLTPLILSNLIYYTNFTKYKKQIYFFIITIPILIECLSRMISLFQ